MFLIENTTNSNENKKYVNKKVNMYGTYISSDYCMIKFIFLSLEYVLYSLDLHPTHIISSCTSS